MLPVETNMVIFELESAEKTTWFVDGLLQQDIRVSKVSPTQIRMVTHLDISSDMITRTCEVIAQLTC
jgi:threonine aldolase